MMRPTLAPVLQLAEGRRREPKSQIDLLFNIRDRQITSHRFGPNRRKLRVCNSNDPQAIVQVDQHTMVVEDFHSGEPGVWLMVSYRACCAPGDETRLVEALGAEDDPRDALERQLARWTSAFVEQAPFSLEELATHLDAIRDMLVQRAASALGLTVDMRCELGGLDRLSAIQIGPMNGDFRVGGQDRACQAEVELLLPVDERHAVRALRLASDVDQLEATVLDQVAHYFETAVTLHDVVYNFEATVVPGVQRHLTQWSMSQGRRVERLRLVKRAAVEGIQRQIKVAHTFNHELLEQSESVQVKCHFLLQLENLGQYVQAGQRDLEDWAAETVERVAHSVLFSLSYLALIEGLDTLKIQLRQKMEAEAYAIGYRVHQFYTVTDLQADRLKKRFTLDPVQDDFATKQPKVRAGLETVVTAQIDQMSAISDHLARREDVMELMRQEIRRFIASRMHEVDPEDFYLRFRTPDSKRSSVDLRLQAELKGHLRQEFGANVHSIVFKQTDTEITQQLNDLKRRPHPIELNVRPRQVDAETMVFDARLVVKSLAEKGWDNFLATRHDPTQLLTTLKEAIEFRLEEAPANQLMRISPERLRIPIGEWARERIAAQYGLEIEITDLRRRLTGAEKAAVTLNEKKLEETLKLGISAIESAARKAGIAQQAHESHFESRLAQIKQLQQELINETDPLLREPLEQDLARLRADLRPDDDEDPIGGAVPTWMRKQLGVGPTKYINRTEVVPLIDEDPLDE